MAFGKKNSLLDYVIGRPTNRKQVSYIIKNATLTTHYIVHQEVKYSNSSGHSTQT